MCFWVCTLSHDRRWRRPHRRCWWWWWWCIFRWTLISIRCPAPHRNGAHCTSIQMAHTSNSDSNTRTPRVMWQVDNATGNYNQCDKLASSANAFIYDSTPAYCVCAYPHTHMSNTFVISCIIGICALCWLCSHTDMHMHTGIVQICVQMRPHTCGLANYRMSCTPRWLPDM